MTAEARIGSSLVSRARLRGNGAGNQSINSPTSDRIEPGLLPLHTNSPLQPLTHHSLVKWSTPTLWLLLPPLELRSERRTVPTPPPRTTSAQLLTHPPTSQRTRSEWLVLTTAWNEQSVRLRVCVESRVLSWGANPVSDRLVSGPRRTTLLLLSSRVRMLLRKPRRRRLTHPSTMARRPRTSRTLPPLETRAAMRMTSTVSRDQSSSTPHSY